MTNNVFTADDIRTMAFKNAAAVMRFNCLLFGNFLSLGQMALATQTRFERRWSIWKSITGAKSPRQAPEIHTGPVSTGLQLTLITSIPITKAPLRLVEQTMEPIGSFTARPASLSG